MGESGISLLAKMADPHPVGLLLHRRLLRDRYVGRFAAAMIFRILRPAPGRRR
jgi:hypothetical protein